MTPTVDLPARPKFSLITAVYNVARYLPDFIQSIDAQRSPDGSLQVIAVDDGSTDDSLRILEDWAKVAPYEVEVISKPNGGQGSARNLGLKRARGEWVTFPDPDDLLADDYLAVVSGLIEARPELQMIATNRIFFDEDTGLRRDGHPLRKLFRRTRSVDLDRFPGFFHGSAPAAFLRLDLLRELNLEFDERIRPNFEDGHLCARYLLGAPSRWVGFVREAEYIYRKRADGSSTLQTSVSNPQRFTVVPELGYLALLESAQSSLGYVPEWVQNLIVYELSWYFSAEDAPTGSMTAAVGEAAERFHQLLPQILSYIDPVTIAAHRVRALKPVWRDALLHAWAGSDWHSPYAVAGPVELDRGLVRIVYRYVGTAPEVQFLSRGLSVDPLHSKVRSVMYFDRVIMHERIVWLDARGTLRMRLGGGLVEIKDEWDPPLQVSRHFPTEHESALAAGEKSPAGLRGAPAGLLRKAAARKSARDFQRAWVLVDRIHDADDSAEVLFRYLRATRPDINAWFTIEEGTPDWNRLVRDGFGDRIVAWGSPRWKSLMANCEYLISSHIDVPIHRPPDVLEVTEPTWRFIFLQHGIIKDDISNWLNAKELALFVTSTQDEYRSVAGDDTRYVFTTKEVKNTGLPRFDALLEVATKYPPERRDLFIVAPTWRHWLVPPTNAHSQRREVHDGFWDTPYARNWMGILESERVRTAAKEQGLQVAFLPHPNLQGILHSGVLPEHVLPLRFEGNDVRSYFARAALVTTDYSSMAFNAAYLERPVTYFQFDSDRMFGGGHVGRGGYFDYERDGLGPLSFDLAKAETDIVSILESGCVPAPVYMDRIRATFPNRDGRCCELITAEIEALSRPLTAQERATPVPTPSVGSGSHA